MPDPLESLTAEIGQTLNRLQTAHEERDEALGLLDTLLAVADEETRASPLGVRVLALLHSHQREIPA